MKKTKKAEQKKWIVTLRFTDAEAAAVISVVKLKKMVGNFCEGNPIDDVAFAVAKALYKVIQEEKALIGQRRRR